MSRIIDTLKKKNNKHDDGYDFVQEELSKAFFGTSIKKTKPKKPSKPPWIAAAAILVIMIIAFLFYTQFDVNVKPKTKSAKEIFFIKDGKPDMDAIKGISVEGDARRLSAPLAEAFQLLNGKGKHGWANLEIVLKNPIDLNKNSLSYIARGQNGDEYLMLVLVDSSNRSYRIQKKSSSFLSKDWKKYILNPKEFEGAIDFSKIAKIQFEFGGLTAGNYPSATIFIKDISIEHEGAKWF